MWVMKDCCCLHGPPISIPAIMLQPSSFVKSARSFCVRSNSGMCSLRRNAPARGGVEGELRMERKQNSKV